MPNVDSIPPPRVTGKDHLDRPLRVGIISNPLSGQNARHGLLTGLGQLLHTYPKVEHRIGDTLDFMQAATEDLIAREVDVLVANGGDGTVQAILTQLLRPARASLPVLAVLRGGSSSCTAHNFGFGKRPLPAVAQLLQAAGEGRLGGAIEAHPVMRIEGAGDPQYAMMYGAGAVYHGIAYFHHNLETRGLHGQLGAGLAIATFAVKLVGGQLGELFPPFSADVRIDGELLPAETYLGILMSTMTRQVVGFRPHWGVEPKPLHITLLRTSPRRVLRVLPSLFRETNRSPLLAPENGFRSHNADEIVISFDSGFTLDGELFALEQDRHRLTLTARQSAYFLRMR